MHDRVAIARLYRTWAVPGLLDAAAAARRRGDRCSAASPAPASTTRWCATTEIAVAVTASYQAFHRSASSKSTVDVKPGRTSATVSARLDEMIADYVAKGPTADEVARVATTRMAERIRALEPIGGFSGKAVVLAEGELYADDPAFYRRKLAGLRRRDAGVGAKRWRAG